MPTPGYPAVVPRRAVQLKAVQLKALERLAERHLGAGVLALDVPVQLHDRRFALVYEVLDDITDGDQSGQ